MKLEAIKKNAIATIEQQQKAARAGKDFSGAVIVQNERLIKLVDEIAPKITPEEWKRIKAGTPGIKRNMIDCKDIKEKYNLSWSELEILKDC